jgi:hypothetical protein
VTQTSRAFNIAESTVKVHLKAIPRKIRAQNPCIENGVGIVSYPDAAPPTQSYRMDWSVLEKKRRPKNLTNDFGINAAYATGWAVPSIGVGYDLISLGNCPDCCLRSAILGVVESRWRMQLRRRDVKLATAE